VDGSSGSPSSPRNLPLHSTPHWVREVFHFNRLVSRFARLWPIWMSINNTVVSSGCRKEESWVGKGDVYTRWFLAMVGSWWSSVLLSIWLAKLERWWGSVVEVADINAIPLSLISYNLIPIISCSHAVRFSYLWCSIFLDLYQNPMFLIPVWILGCWPVGVWFWIEVEIGDGCELDFHPAYSPVLCDELLV